MKGHTMKGHRCQWHDLVCDKELESCIECERFPDNEGKPNFTAEPMQALRECSYGVTITVCPACHEPAYEEGRCVFCGQRYTEPEVPPEDIPTETALATSSTHTTAPSAERSSQQNSNGGNNHDKKTSIKGLAIHLRTDRTSRIYGHARHGRQQRPRPHPILTNRKAEPYRTWDVHRWSLARRFHGVTPPKKGQAYEDSTSGR